MKWDTEAAEFNSSYALSLFFSSALQFCSGANNGAPDTIASSSRWEDVSHEMARRKQRFNKWVFYLQLHHGPLANVRCVITYASMPVYGNVLATYWQRTSELSRVKNDKRQDWGHVCFFENKWHLTVARDYIKPKLLWFISPTCLTD